MDETVRSTTYLLNHDPWVIGGLLLIGLASILFIHIQLKLLRVGYKSFHLFKYVLSTSLLVRSPPPLPTIFLMIGHLAKTRGGKKGQILSYPVRIHMAQTGLIV